ncbi:flagellar biosynthesis protein FlhF [Alkalihalobacillus sp. NPDC078783]
MKLKKFQVESMPEALQQIKNELGSEAVILHTKEISTGGWFGFFAKKKLEVTAAIDPAKAAIAPKRPQPSLQQSQKEIVSNQVPIPRVQSLSSSSQLEAPVLIRQIDDELGLHGVEESIREELKEDAFGFWYSQEKKNRTPSAVITFTRQWLKRRLQNVTIGHSLFDKKYMIFAGPTGVGKTTTIAKLAAEASIKHGKKVAILTTDTYRIAAIDQLKTYASILNVPIEVAYSLEDFHAAMDQFEAYDVVLVDTAGRNFTHDFYLKELQKTIHLSEEASLYVVLALTSKYSDMVAVLDQFKQLSVRQVIFTKKDETNSYGALINVCLNEGIGIAYLTNGQNVPDDVLPASVDHIVEAVLEGMTLDGSS